MVTCAAGLIFGIHNFYQCFKERDNFRNNFNTVSTIVYNTGLQNKYLKKEYDKLEVYKDEKIKNSLDEVISSSENFIGAVGSNPQFIEDKTEFQKKLGTRLGKAGIGLCSFLAGLIVAGVSTKKKKEGIV